MMLIGGGLTVRTCQDMFITIKICCRLCACACVWVCVCACVCLHVCVRVQVCMCTCVCKCACLILCVCVSVCIHLHNLCVSECGIIRFQVCWAHRVLAVDCWLLAGASVVALFWGGTDADTNQPTTCVGRWEEDWMLGIARWSGKEEGNREGDR